MSGIRRLAMRLLRFVVARSSAENQSWGCAMAREMDFVDNDWLAAFWALGSASALCRYGISQQLRALLQRSNYPALSLKDLAKKAPAMLSGIVAAGAVLTLCVLLLSSLVRASWFDPSQAKLAERLLFVAVPEAVYLASAIAFWRRSKAMAVGILAAATILIAHAFVHFVTHG
jgi:putative effector of murein hydrolase LrgA (UPF0299 family)